MKNELIWKGKVNGFLFKIWKLLRNGNKKNNIYINSANSAISTFKMSILKILKYRPEKDLSKIFRITFL